MEFRLLKYFLAIAECESISKATEILHITQPTLSRQLAQLEEEAGAKLFVRGSRRLILTNEGLLLKRRAQEILELVEKTESELHTKESEVSGKISIGVGMTRAMHFMADVISSFTKKYPKVAFNIFTATADVVSEQMEKGLVDIGLFIEPFVAEKFDFLRLPETICKEQFVVAINTEHKLAKKKFISPNDLVGTPLCLPARLNVQSELAAWFGDYFKKLNIAFISNLAPNAVVLVSKNLCCAIMVDGAAEFCDVENVVYRPLKPALKKTNIIAWKRNVAESLAVQKFIEEIRATM